MFKIRDTSKVYRWASLGKNMLMFFCFGHSNLEYSNLFRISGFDFRDLPAYFCGGFVFNFLHIFSMRYFGSWMWLSLHFGHLLGALSLRLSLKIKPQFKQPAGSRIKRRGGWTLFCTWTRCCRTSLTEMCTSADNSCKVHEPSAISSAILWRCVGIFLEKPRTRRTHGG